MTGHEHPPASQVALVTISVQGADGGVVARRWWTHTCCAEDLAADLGLPHQESITSPEAAHDLAALAAATPGTVTTGMADG